ncbi:hypothetical protein A2801_04105 [Candidatus Woesebacteria bacterium RIFCSPHIGHO2_01_FULL_41_10]|uniref:HIT domain-containing protein n=1 Tax=Candidatus Woesebacteria bacterium RIFCSPHIGHO2_01_FULL_41_10 TaxID=1802500 RepID=A0A1F7YLP3_9BACT|nr:MAG: hypothetical protein A2801_04105 [Candidatus Woesebacteria bacterium RIFCSPHIGHO2_01_FULL_41_10]
MTNIDSKHIYSGKYFNVLTLDRPHITRADGGHLVIVPKREIEDRTELTQEEAQELMKLSIAFGKAMKIALNKRGIDIERINYQENGNWVPKMHLHLYGRARLAKTQKFGEALHFPKPETGFYDNNVPLDEKDINEIKKEAEKLL